MERARVANDERRDAAVTHGSEAPSGGVRARARGSMLAQDRESGGNEGYNAMTSILTVLPDFLLDFAVANRPRGAVSSSSTPSRPRTTSSPSSAATSPSAALALGLSLVGFAIPLSSAMVFSATFLDLVLWGGGGGGVGLVALLVQIAIYAIVRVLIPDLSPRIAKGEIAPALFLGAASVAAGLGERVCDAVLESGGAGEGGALRSRASRASGMRMLPTAARAAPLR